MDVLSDLLSTASAVTPAHVAKSENAAKDRKHKGMPYKQIKTPVKDENTTLENTEASVLKTKESKWTKTDRRSTNDRRKQLSKRGRWLESRDKKDRRAVEQIPEISVTI